jgi:seryl-tRNA synthetase
MHIEGCKIPNQTHPEAPRGAEDKATLLKLVGNKPNFDFTPKDHIELGKKKTINEKYNH